jgi:hypothetical protein
MTLACNGSGEKIVYVGTEEVQTAYIASGFSTIGGYYLFENIFLSSFVADAFVADTYGPNVYTITGGVIGSSLVYGC